VFQLLRRRTISRKHIVRLLFISFSFYFFANNLAGRLAIKHHPDKNPDDPLSEDRFKSIAIAYQTLSDLTLRKKYNEFGPKESAPEGGYVDPEEVFGAIFGGDKFLPIIGQISLARDMKSALQEAEEASDDAAGGKAKVMDANGREVISPEEQARRKEKERVKAEKDRQKAAEVRLFSFVSFLIELFF
jgi:DnaJ-class molecular chaperone